MAYIENFIKELPEMKSGEELIEELSIFPEYDDSIRHESQTVRLMRLSDLYRLYVPSNMSTEIYAKLYLALLRSLQKKGTQAAVQQKYQNYNRIQNQEYRGILGGSDSFTIIGTSGIGKSSAISRAIELITENRDTLPLVKDAIKKLQGKEGERPKKVSIYAVEKMLGLPDKRIAQYLPKCREEIERHEETQEKYWAREVVWAVDTIRKNGDILNWKHIRNLTNMRKKNFIACATYLSEYSNEYLSIVNTLM